MNKKALGGGVLVVLLIFLGVFFGYNQVFPNRANPFKSFWRAGTTGRLLEQGGKFLRQGLFSWQELVKQGEEAFSKSDFKTALEKYREALLKSPNNRILLSKVGEVAFLVHQYQLTEEVYQKLVGFDPQNPTYRLGLAKSYLNLGKWEETNTLLKNSASTKEVWYCRLLLDVYFGFHTEAKNLIKQLLAVEGEFAAKQLAQSFAENYRSFEAFSDGQPVYLETLLARSLTGAGENQLAIFKLKKVLAEKPDYRDAWVLLGYNYYFLERFTEAREAFNKAYELDPSHLETQYFLGEIALVLKDQKEALKFFELVYLEGSQKFKDVCQKLGELYFHFGQYSGAEKCYTKLLVERDYADAELMLKVVVLNLKLLEKNERAHRFIERFVEKFPQDGRGQILQKWWQLRQVETKKTDQIVELTAIDQLGLFAQGDLYEIATRKREAMEAYQKTYLLDKESWLGRLAAENYNRLAEK